MPPVGQERLRPCALIPAPGSSFRLRERDWRLRESPLLFVSCFSPLLHYGLRLGPYGAGMAVSYRWDTAGSFFCFFRFSWS